jgi:hypothetical protein
LRWRGVPASPLEWAAKWGLMRDLIGSHGQRLWFESVNCKTEPRMVIRVFKCLVFRIAYKIEHKPP